MYDHEEEIIAASNQGSLLATMDTEGNVLVRDVTNHNEILYQIKIYKQYETGCLLFNQNKEKEVFVFCNNEVELYDADGRVVQRMEFDHNVVCATQDDDIVVIAYQTGGIACYDWTKDMIVCEILDVGPFKSLTSSRVSIPTAERVIVGGGESGEVLILKL